MSTAFLCESIDKKLAELRDNCAVQREIKRRAFGRRWARAGRSDAENRRDSARSDQRWDEEQATAQRESTAATEAADQTLAEFIAEHRYLMPAGWICNEHGRLCWAPCLGGSPINQHYCHLDEGHDGNHANDVGAWPQGVTCEHEWHQQKANAV